MRSLRSGERSLEKVVAGLGAALLCPGLVLGTDKRRIGLLILQGNKQGLR